MEVEPDEPGGEADVGAHGPADLVPHDHLRLGARLRVEPYLELRLSIASA
jgi:hypothetical protein